MITRARVDGRKFLRYYLITRRRVSSRGGNYMTKTCTFFGHKDTPETVKNGLHTTIEKLITEYGVETFYVGNQGAFDFHTRAALRQLQEKYPYIRYAVVLAYMPGEVSEYEDHSDTLLGIIFNGFCFINLIPHFFDYLMCPYYPALYDGLLSNCYRW